MFYLIFNYSRKLIKFLLKSAVVGGITVFLLNAYWIIPMFLYKPHVFYDERMLVTSSLMGAGKYTGTLLQAWHLTPLSWSNIYFPGSMLIIILFIGFFLFKWKPADKWWISFLGITTMIFVFLGKGTFPPLGGLYVWFSQNIPFFVGYRVSSKFLLISAFTLSIIIGWFIQRIAERHEKRHFSSTSFKVIIITTLSVLIIGNSWYMLRGYGEKFGNEMDVEYAQKYKNEQNMFWPTILDQWYVELWDYIKNSNTDGKRAIWYPKVNRYRLATSESPLVSSNDTFYYQEDSIDNVFGPKGLVMNPIFHRLDIFMNLVNAKNIIVRPADELDWNYSRSQPYFRVIRALNNQYYLKQKYLFDMKPYMLFDADNIDWNTNGELSTISDNFYPQGKSIKYFSGFDNTFVSVDNITKVDLNSYGFFTFWIKAVKPETISFAMEDSSGYVYDGYFKVSGKLEWENITLPIDPELSDISSVKLYMIGENNTLTFTPFVLEPAGLRIYELDSFTQDLVQMDQAGLGDTLELANWQTHGDASIETIDTGFGMIDVLNYFSNEMDTYIARSFEEPISVDDYDAMLFWMRFTKPETIEIYIRDSYDNVQKKVVKVTTDNTWEPIYIVFDSVIHDIEAITIKNVVTNNDLQITPFTMIKSNIVPYKHSEYIDEIYLSDLNIHVPNQKIFSCFQVQQKNFPIKWAMIGDVIPDGVPYHELGECINWLFMDSDSSGSSSVLDVNEISTVHYEISFDKKLENDTVLVFGQSYSPYWEAFYNDEGGEKIKIDNHFPVNGYANAWYVPEGVDSVELVFKPEWSFKMGLIITVLSIVGGLIMMIFEKVKNKYF